MLGFPVAILFAWAYELTPEGIKREKDVDRSQSIASHTGQRLDRIIIGILVIVVGLLLVDKFLLTDSAVPTKTSQQPATAAPTRCPPSRCCRSST